MSTQMMPVRDKSGLELNCEPAQLVVTRRAASRVASDFPEVNAVTKISQITLVQTNAKVPAVEVFKPGAKQVQYALDDINKVLIGFSISSQFRVDPDFKELIVKVVDVERGRLMRQFPTEDVVEISTALDRLKGFLFAKSV